MKNEISQRTEFECVYVSDHEINAHRYRLEVTAECPQRTVDGGIILDFKKFKKYLIDLVPDKYYIYSLVQDSTYNRDGEELARVFQSLGYLTTAYNFLLSCENLCSYFAMMLQEIFNVREPGVVVTSVKLRENSDSFAAWHI